MATVTPKKVTAKLSPKKVMVEETETEIEEPSKSPDVVAYATAKTKTGAVLAWGYNPSSKVRKLPEDPFKGMSLQPKRLVSVVIPQ